jgi:PKD repeat protein
MKYSKLLLLIFSVLTLSGQAVAQQKPACGMPDNVLENPANEAAYNRFREKMEPIARAYMQSQVSMNKTSENPNKPKFIIPCVVHVCFNEAKDSLSFEQVYSQFVALNNDFRRIPGTRGFSGGADTEIEFNLATIDEKGNPFNGIVYHKLDPKWVDMNQGDDIEFKTKIAPGFNPRNYFNIWLVKSIKDDGGLGELAGYAQFPDPEVYTRMGKVERSDGVVCINSDFGTTGTSGSYSSTMSHEIGHWLWLYHTFQGGCPSAGQACNREGDRICDTPPVVALQFKNPFIRLNTCSETPVDRPDNPRNYMDYTSPDEAVNVFTQGQKEVFFQTLLNKEWPWRYNLWQPQNITKTGTGSKSKPTASFWAEPRVVFTNTPVKFMDYSIGSPTSWRWEFPGGTPETSTDPAPVVTYSQPGKYEVKLVIQNESTWGIDSIIRSEFITVYAPKVVKLTPTTTFMEDFSMPANQFPPDGWIIDNPDEHIRGGSTWTITKRLNSYARGGDQGVARLNFFTYSHYNQKDGLILPAFDLSELTTPSLRFDFSYSPIVYTKTHRVVNGIETPIVPVNGRSNELLELAIGTTYNDTLEILASTDNGITWESLWKKGGRDLMTVRQAMRSTRLGEGGDFSSPTAQEWDSTGIDLNKFAGKTNVMLKFETTSGYGNNLYLDRIRIRNKAWVSAQEQFSMDHFKVFPNPTRESALISFESDRNIGVSYNLSDIQGRKIYSHPTQTFGNGKHELTVDLNDLPAGIYVLTIQSGDQFITRKLVKY